ncbi:hypothetical protein CP082626L3_0805, partial [Chlamydia psittaci 08-2626_L3]
MKAGNRKKLGKFPNLCLSLKSYTRLFVSFYLSGNI